jgi:hypothetical protein
MTMLAVGSTSRNALRSGGLTATFQRLQARPASKRSLDPSPSVRVEDGIGPLNSKKKGRKQRAASDPVFILCCTNRCCSVLLNGRVR